MSERMWTLSVFSLQQIAEADFDGSEYGMCYLQIYVGDVLEQEQIILHGWTFGADRPFNIQIARQISENSCCTSNDV